MLFDGAIIDIGNIGSIAIGAAGAAAALLAYAKMKGFVTPDAVEEIEEALDDIRTEFSNAIGNVSLSELGELIGLAKEYAENGYTQEELENLGKKFIDMAADSNQ